MIRNSTIRELDVYDCIIQDTTLQGSIQTFTTDYKESVYFSYAMDIKYVKACIYKTFNLFFLFLPIKVDNYEVNTTFNILETIEPQLYHNYKNFFNESIIRALLNTELVKINDNEYIRRPIIYKPVKYNQDVTNYANMIEMTNNTKIFIYGFDHFRVYTEPTLGLVKENTHKEKVSVLDNTIDRLVDLYT